MESSFIVFTVLFCLFERSYSQLTCEDLPQVPRLEPVNAGNPPFSSGTEVRYGCTRGYVRLEGNNLARCVGPEWIEPSLTCSGISCGEPDDSPNARKIGTQFTFPNNVTYVCDEGYERVGARSILFCLPSGSWSADAPRCKIISCGELPSIVNGYVRYEPDNQDYESEATYVCNGGFKLNGSPKRECRGNGTWSGVEPACQISMCKPYSSLPYGHIIHNANATKVGDLVIFKCNDAGSTPRTIKCQPDGTWTDEPPNCPAPPTSSPPVTFSTKTSVTPSTTTSKSEKADVSGDKSLCEDPGLIENGYVAGAMAFPTNGSVVFQCVDGFNLKGSPTLTCLSNGKWSSASLPRCQKRLSIEMIAGIVVGVVSLLILLAVGVVLYLKKRNSRLTANPGLKNKAQSMDAKHVDEIRNLERDKKKPIPVTSL